MKLPSADSEASLIEVKFFLNPLLCPKCTGTGWGFDFNSPKEFVLELTGNHYSCSDHISWEATGIWLRLTYYGQRLRHWLRSTNICPKMLRLRCQVEYFAEMYLFLLFTHLYYLSNTKSMLIPNLRYLFIQTHHINHLKCWLPSEGGVTENDFEI